MNLNKVIICGNLTRSPELRHSANGNAIANFSIATNRAWTDERGERHEEVEFHRITLFGRQAETAAEYLTKGQLAMVEGRLQYDKWKADGVERTGVKIIADRVQFGPKRVGSMVEPDDYPETSDKSDPAASADEDINAEPDEQLVNDDIPF
jgi:single-strand DNA-binding protein